MAVDQKQPSSSNFGGGHLSKASKGLGYQGFDP